MTQVVIIVVIIAILIALGLGLLGMLKGGSAGSDKMFKSLVIRVVLSLFLFILVMFAAFMGWIEPNVVMMDASTLK